MSASTVTPVYTVTPPPELPANKERPQEKLSPSEESMFETVLAHFSKPDYKLSVVKEEPELRDIEKFWLVRTCGFRCHV